MCVHACHSCHRKSPDQSTPAEEDFSFVEQPSKDFFSPVTFDLLFQPHLTACCGKHLSHEVVTILQREGMPCPMCQEPNLNTVLNKHFLRQVSELRVFCHHEDRGCKWQGELPSLGRHLQSCSYSDISRYTLHIKLLTCTVIIYYYLLI